MSDGPHRAAGSAAAEGFFVPCDYARDMSPDQPLLAKMRDVPSRQDDQIWSSGSRHIWSISDRRLHCRGNSVRGTLHVSLYDMILARDGLGSSAVLLSAKLTFVRPGKGSTIRNVLELPEPCARLAIGRCTVIAAR